MGMFKKEKEPVTVTEPETTVEPEFPRKSSSGSGTTTGYTVEARLNFNEQSKIINGMALGPKWARLSFETGQVGVPKGLMLGVDMFSPLLTYATAQALRWWFVAAAAVTYEDICLETRLVEHAYQYSHDDKELGVVEEITRHCPGR